MGYGLLNPSLSIPQPTHQPPTSNSKSWTRFLLLGTLAAVFLASSATAVVYIVRSRAGSPPAQELRQPSSAISQTCRFTLYPDLCVASLMEFPGALDAGEQDLVHISVNMTLRRVSRAVYGASAIANVEMDDLARSAYGDCMELLDSSSDQLSRSLAVINPSGQESGEGSGDDVMTWLSAALTNQDTCSEGLEGVAPGYVKDQMNANLKDLTELVSNSLAIFTVSAKNQDFSGIPIQNRRRKLLGKGSSGNSGGGAMFPSWVGKKDRRLLQLPASALQADMVVSSNGNGTHMSIEAAIKAAPERSSGRTIIYIRAGRYKENIKVSRKKTNLMFIGDGRGKTVITGYRSVADHYTTFHTATFAATGAGFIARDITFENTAGPEKHQAVALRVGADHSVVYRCEVIGYQDTLYVHSQRQFYRECDVYGTVDFIFGNAAVVLQKCNIFARKPMDQQKNTITAQNRKDPNQNTGISIHDCRILPATDLERVKWKYPTFLGRPWKMYSRVVYMLDYMGDHINPAGWLEWNGNFALDTLYYGEYMNYGPGAAVGKRVNWPGYRVITMAEEASKFTVGKFISGSSWLPSTGVAFLAGLSV